MVKQRCFWKCITRTSPATHHLWLVTSCPCAGQPYLAHSGKVHLLKLSLNLAQEGRKRDVLLEKHSEKHTWETRDCKDKKLSRMDDPTKITNDDCALFPLLHYPTVWVIHFGDHWTKLNQADDCFIFKWLVFSSLSYCDEMVKLSLHLNCAFLILTSW